MTNEEQLAPEHAARQKAPRGTTAEDPSVRSTAAAQTSSASDLWEQIRRHKVVEWTLAYVAAGFALVHAVEMASHAFEWPRLVSKLTIVGWLAGIPVAATLAWYHGHRAQQRVSRAELSILILLLFLVGSALWFFTRTGNEHQEPRVLASQQISGNSANTAPAFAPPPHSIAVLPFVNMSGDTAQDYFSDGLTEEILNSLARISELQVAARTSSFSFKGKDADISTIAHKLNVGAVLEGSVRRSGNKLRITTQLSNAVTGFHLWSQTYDRDLGDVLKLQTEIANAVADALKVTLLGDVTAKIEVGGTRKPAAFDAYLHALKIYFTAQNEKDARAAAGGFTEAIRLDPSYALAYAARSRAIDRLAFFWAKGSALLEYRNKAQADALRAIALAPDLAEGHLALATLYKRSLKFADATGEYERAQALAPGNAMVLRDYGTFAVQMGHTELGLAAVRRAVQLDPLNARAHLDLGVALADAGHTDQAVAALRDAEALAPNDGFVNGWLGYAYFLAGSLESARTTCERADEIEKLGCLAFVYDRLGRHAEAESLLAQLRASFGENVVLMIHAFFYAHRGDPASALDYLETALRRHDPALVFIKTHPAFVSLRGEPRFQAIERALKFPD